MNNLFDIKGNVTAITGGTGVLGRAIAKYLALNGARVVILGRKEDVGNQIAADIRAEGGECEFMKTEELCGTIHYLMSDASKFVTGTVAVVDGGFNMFAM